MGTNLNEPPVADIELNHNKMKGLVFISNNNLFTRLWFLLSNPFRYIFTGKIRY